MGDTSGAVTSKRRRQSGKSGRSSGLPPPLASAACRMCWEMTDLGCGCRALTEQPALIYLLLLSSLLSQSSCCQEQLSHTCRSPAPGSPALLKCCFPPWGAKPALPASVLGRNTQDRCYQEKYQCQLPLKLRQAVANLCCTLTSVLFPLPSTPQVNLMRTLSSHLCSRETTEQAKMLLTLQECAELGSEFAQDCLRRQNHPPGAI